MHELRVMAPVELHANTTYYAQHPALKSVWKKPISKLFSFYRAMFQLAQSLQDQAISEKIQTGGNEDIDFPVVSKK